MYLTRFEINPQRRDARLYLASPQRLHAGVMAAFPDDHTTAEDRRILWRVDQGHHDATLFLVSPDKPDLTHLVETIGRPTYGWQTRDYQPFLERLGAGGRWAFRLLANPVRSLPAPEGGRGKRVGHVTVAQQLDWFHRQAARHGFAATTTTADAPDVVLRDRRIMKFDRRGRTVTLATAVFAGTLTVTDPEALRTALRAGIGPGKGYGCGLMTLAAAS